MRKNLNKKTKKTKLGINVKELPEVIERREKEREELERIAKLLVRRDLELLEIREKREKEIEELDRIAKMLVRRDFELSEIQTRREAELKELEKRTKELNESRKSLMNILEDVETARAEAEEERDKTLAIIENFPEGLLLFNEKNNLSSINPKTQDFFKIEVKELIGKNIRELRKISSLAPLMEILGEELKGIYQKELKLREGLVLED